MDHDLTMVTHDIEFTVSPRALQTFAIRLSDSQKRRKPCTKSKTNHTEGVKSHLLSAATNTNR